LPPQLSSDFATASHISGIVEDVIRRALETLYAEESWTDGERRALDEKIARALEQVAAGRVYGPEAARQKLAALREAHLANPG
jgi:hypothetical protein